MKKLTITIILISLFIVTCKSQNSKDKFILDDDNLYVENFDSLNNDVNRFTADNKILTPGKSFVYKYYYQDNDGMTFNFIQDSILKKENEIRWNLIDTNSEDQNAIKYVILKVHYGLNPFENDPLFKQTVIKYNYQQVNGKFATNEMTGGIENVKNVWIHPPRTDFFQILEINPFPYIKAPFEIGNKWNWSLRIGGHYSDSRWLLWKGNIVNEYQYEITGKVVVKTGVGDLDCWEITSTAKSEIFETGLKSYFNDKFGFVKLIYANCDGSSITLELDKVENN